MSEEHQKKLDGKSAIAGPSNNIPSPLILKLNIDCFDKIFDYLSVKDLHTFGLTCKTMQYIAGEYFMRNHAAAAKYTENDGIYTEYSDRKGVVNQRTQTSGFNKFITYVSHYYEKMKPLRYIQSHSDEFQSIKHIYLVCTVLNRAKVKCIEKLLNKVAIVQIRNCSVDGEFYATFLKFCKTMKQLYVQDADLVHYRYEENQSVMEWLRQSYPTLEHLELIPQYSNRIEELGSFLYRNQTIRSFSTSSKCLLANMNELLKCEAKLDIFEVKIFNISRFHYNINDEDYGTHIKTICELVNQLYERGFYKRLHFYVQRVNQQCSERLMSLRGLEKLCIKNFSEGYNLSHLTGLRELVILDSANANVNDMEIFANNFVHLQRLYLGNATFNTLLPFVCHSAKLRIVKFSPKSENEGSSDDILKLLTLNKKRKQLDGARKTTIYVPDNYFLATKWTINYGDTDLSLVEMKRTDSYVWDNHY